MKLYEEKVKSLLENEHHKDGNLEQKLLEELKEWESLISKAALTKPILVDHKNKVDRLNSMETRITNQLHHINQWATGLNVSQTIYLNFIQILF